MKDQETGPRLLRAMMDIGAVFHEHAIKDGDGEKLNSNEMKALIQKEFSSVLGVSFLLTVFQRKRQFAHIGVMFQKC